MLLPVTAVLGVKLIKNFAGGVKLAKIEVRSQSGQIDLVLPDKAGFQLVANTDHGEAVNDFGPPIQKETDGQAASLKDYRAAMMLPGIAINTDAGNFRPVRQLRLVQFDGRTWQPIGDVIESAFSNVGRK